jgi:ABC-type multidrug transport system permease subunit
MFYAGGVAFNQSTFYGGLFMILAIILFFIAVYFGRRIQKEK